MTNKMKLGQIPAVNERIAQYCDTYIRVLYYFIYGHIPERIFPKGRIDEICRNDLREFEGFNPYNGLIDSKFDLCNTYGHPITKDELEECCKILGISQEGLKPDLICRLVSSLTDINKLAFTPDNRYVTEKKNINVESNTQGNTQKNADASEVKKRRHSNSNTPSPPMQRKASTSSQQQVNLHRDEIFNIKMAVAHKDYPHVLFRQENCTEIFEEIITNAIEAIDSKLADSKPPQFLGFDFEEGVLMVICANENTKIWLMQTVNRLIDSSMVVEPENLLKKKKYGLRAYIPKILEEKRIRLILSNQNPELNIDMWNIEIQTTSEENNKQTSIQCDVDHASFSFLEKNNFEAYWVLGKITFHTIKDALKHTLHAIKDVPKN